MLLSYLISSFFITLALAASDIPAVLAGLANDAKSFDKSLGSWRGDLPGLYPVLQEASRLLDDVQKAANDAQRAPPLTFHEAISLAQNTLDLSTDTSRIMKTVISVKPSFDKYAVADGFVLSNLKSLRSSLSDLSQAIVDKVPDIIKPVAQKLVQELDGELERGIKAYT